MYGTVGSWVVLPIAESCAPLEPFIALTLGLSIVGLGCVGSSGVCIFLLSCLKLRLCTVLRLSNLSHPLCLQV